MSASLAEASTGFFLCFVPGMLRCRVLLNFEATGSRRNKRSIGQLDQLGQGPGACLCTSGSPKPATAPFSCRAETDEHAGQGGVRLILLGLLDACSGVAEWLYIPQRRHNPLCPYRTSQPTCRHLQPDSPQRRLGRDKYCTSQKDKDSPPKISPSPLSAPSNPWPLSRPETPLGKACDRLPCEVVTAISATEVVGHKARQQAAVRATFRPPRWGFQMGEMGDIIILSASKLRES